MPQAVGSPEDLERFANELKHFNLQLHDAMVRLEGQFNRLGDTWRDQEQQKYAREFTQTMLVLRRFMQASEVQIPFLKRKAQRLHEYLRQG